MSNNPDIERDEMWAAIQRAFSPEEAIYFRSYPVRVENSVREIDYFVFHRSGTAMVILVEPVQQKDLIPENTPVEEGISIRDEFSDETRTYYPVALAHAFLSALRNRDLPVTNEVTIIWLPNVAGTKNIAPDLPDGSVVLLFGSRITPEVIYDAAIGLMEEPKPSKFNDTEWLRLKARLNPPSPIQSRTPRLNREEQIKRARKLSDEYIHAYSKSTLIFISYRRDDAGWAAGRIYSHLSTIFEETIFFDYESIKPGAHWVDAIDQALDDCIVQLVVMGPKWATLKKRGASKPRILQPKDMVAHEIRTALRKKVMTIPLLIDGAAMPYGQQLPVGLRQLPKRNAILINQDNYFAKMDVLVDRIIELLEMAI